MIDKNDRIMQWMQFLNVETEEELDMIDNNTNVSDIKKAVAILREMSKDDTMREFARHREKEIADENP